MSKKQKWVSHSVTQSVSEWQCHLLSCQVTAKNIAKLPWHHNSKLSFLSLSFCISTLLSFLFLEPFHNNNICILQPRLKTSYCLSLEYLRRERAGGKCSGLYWADLAFCGRPRFKVGARLISFLGKEQLTRKIQGGARSSLVPTKLYKVVLHRKHQWPWQC